MLPRLPSEVLSPTFKIIFLVSIYCLNSNCKSNIAIIFFKKISPFLKCLDSSSLSHDQQVGALPIKLPRLPCYDYYQQFLVLFFGTKLCLDLDPESHNWHYYLITFNVLNGVLNPTHNLMITIMALIIITLSIMTFR